MLQLKFQKELVECGTDEAGRGCLAGPVTAAAVILPEDFSNLILTDSKLLTKDQRNFLKKIIKEQAICYSVTHVSMELIDEINILNASILAMHKCIAKLKEKPQHIIVDGNRFKNYKKIPHQCVIKGDSKFMSIAAASVLAKTARDAYMQRIHKEFPMYNWKQNKGYPTVEHREAIKKYGITKYHRKSFKLLPEQLELAI